MGQNVKRFMKIWECPKPVLGQVHGWAIGGATDLILCCDLLFMASDAHVGYAPSRIFGTPTTMLWVYRLGLVDGMTRHTEEAYRWVESFETKGFRQVIAERDVPFGDYGASRDR